MDIPANLEYALEYNPELNCLQRKTDIPMIKKNQHDELNFIMSYVTGCYEKINLSMWEYVKEIGYMSYIKYNEDQACMCSQPNCREMFFLRHISTGVIVRLGSQCIITYSPEEREKLEKIKRESIKENCKRVGCINKLDKRTKVGKAGLCSDNCLIEERDRNKSQEEKDYEERMRNEKNEKDEKRAREKIEYDERKRKEKIEKVGNWTIYFGKHEGKTFNEIYETDKNYLNYLHGNHVSLNERIVEWIEYKWSII